MENITFNLSQLHIHGTAFYDFLGLRKRFFVDKLGWDIPHDDDVEMDNTTTLRRITLWCCAMVLLSVARAQWRQRPNGARIATCCGTRSMVN